MNKSTLMLAVAASAILGGAASAQNPSYDLYVSTSGSDSNDGSSWAAPKATIQAAINTAGASGATVHVGPGTYTLTANLTMKAGVRILCIDGATITQQTPVSPKTPVQTFFDFETNTANGASVENCTVDGYRGGTGIPDSANDYLFLIGPANDVRIVHNVIRNASGNGIAISTGLRPIIHDNWFSNIFAVPINLTTAAPSTATAAKIYANNMSGALGEHAIVVSNSDHNAIFSNNITATMQPGMTVDTTEAANKGDPITVTLDSCSPNCTFNTLSPGEFLFVGTDGTEMNIASITDSTHLVVTAPAAGMAARRNAAASGGPGDLIGITASSWNHIENNDISGGAGGGIVFSNFDGGESAQKNLISGNLVSGSGEGCIEGESEAVGNTQVADNTIIGNTLVDCGVGGSASAADTLYGIALVDFATSSDPPSTTLINTFVANNYVRDDQGTPTQNWLGLTGIAAGQVFVGDNRGVGTVMPGIANGISSVTLGAGWGAGASSSPPVSFGNAFYFTVTAGSGASSGASLTVNMSATTMNNPPTWTCKQIGGNNTIHTIFGETPGMNATAGSLQISMVGAPGNQETVQLLCTGN